MSASEQLEPLSLHCLFCGHERRAHEDGGKGKCVAGEGSCSCQWFEPEPEPEKKED